MLQLCVFGGYEGPLGPEKKCCFTVFGGCTLRRPTLARQIVTARNVQEGRTPPPKMIFITIFGGTEIKYPTLAEEFLDLREAINSGTLQLNRWDDYLAQIQRYNSSSLMSLTLFGSYSESELPADDEEIEGLALQRHVGNINEETSRTLEMGVGQPPAQRHALLRQAVISA